MMRAAYLHCLVVASMLFFICACSIGQPQNETQGCVKDDECKGERICENGICVNPDGGDGDGETAEGESEDDYECSGPACNEAQIFCEYVNEQSCNPSVGSSTSMKTCIERLISYRDSGCFDGTNLVLCLSGCAGRSKSCQYLEMCTEDCVNQYCI